MVAKVLQKLSIEKPIFEEPADEKSATEAISKLTKYARAVISAAEELAETHGICFSFDVAWGMGGSYTPKIVAIQEYRDELEDGDEPDEDWEPEEGEDFGWISSSSRC